MATLLVLMLLLVNVTLGQHKLNQPCILSISLPGRCVRMEECAEIANLLNKAVLYATETQKVRTALHICESDENSSDPIVCCKTSHPTPGRPRLKTIIRPTARSPHVLEPTTIRASIEITTSLYTTTTQASTETTTPIPMTTTQESPVTTTDIPVTTTFHATTETLIQIHTPLPTEENAYSEPLADVLVPTTTYESTEASTDMPLSTTTFASTEASVDLPVPTAVDASNEELLDVETPAPVEISSYTNSSADVPIRTTTHASPEKSTDIPVPASIDASNEEFIHVPVPVEIVTSPEPPKDVLVPITTPIPSQRNTSSIHRLDHFEDIVLPANCGIVPATAFDWDGVEDYANIHAWVVILEIKHSDSNNTDHCVGTLIHERIVLVAAHCVHASKPKNIKLYFGVIWTSVLAQCLTNGVCQERWAAKIIIHQDYNPHTRLNDVALVKFNDAVSVTVRVRPACLPLDYQFDVSSQALALGWEATGNAIMDDSKRIVRMGVIGLNQCDERLKNWPHFVTIISSVMCMMSVQPQQDVCFGDSGTPLLQYRNRQFYVVGVISHGPTCGTNRVAPSVALRLSEFTEWILNNMKRVDPYIRDVLEVPESSMQNNQTEREDDENYQSPSNLTNNNNVHNSQQEMDVEEITEDPVNLAIHQPEMNAVENTSIPLNAANMHNNLPGMENVKNVQRHSNSTNADKVKNHQPGTDVEESTEDPVNVTIYQPEMDVVENTPIPLKAAYATNIHNKQPEINEVKNTKKHRHSTKDENVRNNQPGTDVEERTEDPVNLANHQPEMDVVENTPIPLNAAYDANIHNKPPATGEFESTKKHRHSTKDENVRNNQSGTDVEENTEDPVNVSIHQPEMDVFENTPIPLNAAYDANIHNKLPEMDEVKNTKKHRHSTKDENVGNNQSGTAVEENTEDPVSVAIYQPEMDVVENTPIPLNAAYDANIHNKLPEMDEVKNTKKHRHSTKDENVRNNQSRTDVEENTEDPVNVSIHQPEIDVDDNLRNNQRETDDAEDTQRHSNSTNDDNVNNNQPGKDVDKNTESRVNLTNSSDAQINQQKTNVIQSAQNHTKLENKTVLSNINQKGDIFAKAPSLSNVTAFGNAENNSRGTDDVIQTERRSNSTDNDNNKKEQPEPDVVPKTQGLSKSTTKNEVQNSLKDVLPVECGTLLIRAHVWEGIPDEDNIHAWAVFLNIQRSKNSGRCGGTLIHERFVLTAAHCVHNLRPENVKLYFGLVLYSKLQACLDDGTCQERQAAQIIAHEEYNFHAKVNDLALIRLSKAVQFTDDVMPACLFGGSLAKDPRVTAVGWGEYEDGPKSDSKRMVSLRVIEQDKCKDQLKRLARFNISMIYSVMCTMGVQKGQDVCEGDSGSALLQFWKDKYFVVGVVSFGPKCGMTSENAGVATRVSEYQNWILTNLNEIHDE